MSHTPRSRTAGSQSNLPQARPRPPTFWKADEYLVNLAPGWKPMTEAELHNVLQLCGATTPESKQELLGGWNRAFERVMALGGGADLHMWGMKPRSGDRVFMVDIPNSNLSIRMWDGGLEIHCQYCLDFFDTRAQRSVNLPPGYELWPATMNMPGVFTMAGPLGSLENGFGYHGAAIPLGEEKWAVPEGSYITLSRTRDGPNEPFTFAVPVRQQQQQHPVAQPYVQITS